MDDPERDDDWQCDDDLGSLPGCLQTPRTERPGSSGAGAGEPAHEKT